MVNTFPHFPEVIRRRTLEGVGKNERDHEGEIKGLRRPDYPTEFQVCKQPQVQEADRCLDQRQCDSVYECKDPEDFDIVVDFIVRQCPDVPAHARPELQLTTCDDTDGG